jgi:hypothetical protein
MTAAELAAFMAMIMSSPAPFTRSFIRGRSINTGNRTSISSASDDDSDFLEGFGIASADEPQNMRQPTGMLRDVDDLEGILPIHVMQEVDEIRQALQVVQRRHFDTSDLAATSPRIAPTRVDTSSARSVHNFVAGTWSWSNTVTERQLDAGETVAEMRMCLDALSVVARHDAGIGELVDLQPVANAACNALSVWPVASSTASVDLLAESGCGLRRFGVSSRNSCYKAWWNRAGVELASALSDADSAVESALVEVVDE